MQKEKQKQKPIKMTKKTAMYIGFLLSASAMIVIITFLMTKDKAAMRPLLFVGIGLALGSLVLRNLIRFKPEWFGEKPTGDEAETKEVDEKK